MHFYFIRHGQSENNLRWAQSSSYDGRVADPALTAAGELQAEHVASFLAAPDSVGTFAGADVQGFHITHIYTSLMERAVATGHRIAEALDLPLLGWVDIHETGGMFLYDEETDTHTPKPGRGRSYLLAHYPRLILPDEVTDAGWWNRPFEPKVDRAPRAHRVLAELLQKHGESDDGREVLSATEGSSTIFSAPLLPSLREIRRSRSMLCGSQQITPPSRISRLMATNAS